jgi:hypothetical protein
MKRCDNTECAINTRCLRYLIPVDEADGIEYFVPNEDNKTCDFFIELPQIPDSLN